MADRGIIKVMNTGVDHEMTAKVNPALAVLTNNILKVLAST
jgi:hypothetical protein